MSDVWGSIWKSIEKGWEAGAPALGPNVGRGLFSNPFLTERDRDVADVRTLYERVRPAYETSLFFDEERLEAAIVALFRDACRDAGVGDFGRATAIGYDAIKALLRDEFLTFVAPVNGDFTRLTLRDLSELRSFLFQKDAQLQRPDETYDLACRAVRVLLARILDASGEGPSGHIEGGLGFEAYALDSLHNPAAHIEFAWQLFFTQPLVDAGLFVDLRAQLERNALTTCRVDPNDPHAWTTKVYLPTKAKGRTSRELVSDYLADTPLTDLFEARVPVQISNETRFEHCHIIGGTGHGKSQLLLKLIHHDLTENPERPGVIVIDSQGDLIRTISRLSVFDPDEPGSLADRLVIIDPADVEYPASLNLFDVARDRFAAYGPADRERLQNGVIETFEHMFAALLGAELTQKQGVIFKFLARLLLAIPNATIHTLREIMEDGRPFRGHMERLDGAAKHFFASEFFDPSFTQTKKQIAKRLWGVLANPVFERMFSHPRNKVDLFEAMNDGKIVLINTAKDLLKGEGSAIFGRFFIGGIAQAAVERAIIPERERRPCFVYIDEAQDYLDESIAALVNQARKYRVGLTFAHQNLDQLTPSLRASVLASTSIKFAGGVSAKDARAIAEDMHTDPDTLQGMRKRRGETEFACFVKNQTPRALRVSIPLGAVQSLPSLSNLSFERLIDENRRRYCEPVVALSQRPEVSVTAEPPVVVEAATPQAMPSQPPPARDRQVRNDPYLAGQGGKEHKYLQQFIRAAAQERGLKADVEWQVGGGSVDVAVEGAGVRIACEVSVTTDAEHELGNIHKGFAAGFDRIWIVVANDRRRASLQKAIAPRLTDAERERFTVLSATEVVPALDALLETSTPIETSVRGYAVKVRRSALPPDDARRQREAIAAVLAKSAKGLRGE